MIMLASSQWGPGVAQPASSASLALTRERGSVAAAHSFTKWTHSVRDLALRCMTRSLYAHGKSLQFLTAAEFIRICTSMCDAATRYAPCSVPTTPSSRVKSAGCCGGVISPTAEAGLIAASFMFDADTPPVTRIAASATQVTPRPGGIATLSTFTC